MFFNKTDPEKRQQDAIIVLDKRIAALKAHESVIETKITEKDAEIASTISGSVDAIKATHEATKVKLERTLIDTVKERNKFELKLVLWY